VTADHVPAVNVLVDISIIAGPNAGLGNAFNTDDYGEVSVYYSGTGGAGADVIQVSGTFNRQPFSCTASKTWITGPRPTPTRSETVGPTRTATPSATPTVTPTAPPTVTGSRPPTGTPTPSTTSTASPPTATATVRPSPSRTPRPKSTPGQLRLRSPTPTPTPLTCPCIGDCNCDGYVVIDELIKMVNIALGVTDVSVCLAGDVNGDSKVAVNEIISAVNNALNGCPPSVTGTESS
jgi:hypothetical protein